ncbi:flagellar protein FliS [Eubacterium oxidoreducens]|uniref:Flagellar protein FliS n=1 Tax=Eubacterium oxidoreducens TaxID=1732 RepID=A0A1G6CII0_EUBOX|nr:flagellar protein FliS [Eubacterium oxidoreducens]SDB32674.1 flagellar protein FliS [Eubacterium oxidoreducens]
MQAHVKQDFTRRISKANKTELVEIIFDICFAYMEEAKAAKEAQEHNAFKDAVRGATRTVQQLKANLNFEYPIAAQLYRLYQFALERLSVSMYRYDLSGIEEAKVVLRPIKEAFAELARQDSSGPMMHNTQKVYAGMTYGRNELSENLIGDINRGFLA